MNKTAHYLVAILFVALIMSTAASADTVSISPSRDNSMFSENGSLSNGSGIYLFTGRTLQSNNRRALLHFDIAGNVPPGATIDSVTLTMNMSKTIASATDVSLHRVDQDWGEAGSDAPAEEGTGTAADTGDATWDHTFFSSSFWNSPGGDFQATSSATTSVAGLGSYSWSSSDMADNVQDWLDNGDNFGWIVIGNESSVPTAKRFDSRENSTGPALEVTFTAGGGSSGGVPAVGPFGTVVMALMLLVGFGVVVRMRRVRAG